MTDQFSRRRFLQASAVAAAAAAAGGVSLGRASRAQAAASPPYIIADYTSGSTQTTSFTVPINKKALTAGDALLVAIGNSTIGNNVATVTDSRSNPYQLDNASHAERPVTFAYVIAPTALTTSDHLTITLNSSAALRVIAVGMPGVTAKDLSPAGSGGTGSSFSVSTGTLAQQNELCLGLVCNSGSTGPGTDWTLVEHEGSTPVLTLAYTMPGATTASQTFSGSLASGTSYDAGVITFETSSGGVQPVGVPGSWNLTWSDEFPGTALDTTKWYAATNGTVRNNVPCFASNVTVSGGILKLHLASSTSGCEIDSGAVRSGDPLPSNGYKLPVGGVAEARINFPGNGTTLYNWPAWWMVGGYSNWPACGEYDIAEVLSSGLASHVIGTSLNAGSGDYSGTWANAYHTYSCWRTSTEVSFYYDGTLMFQHAPNDTGVSMGLILNNGVSDASSGNSPHSYPADVLVDYVRAWVPA